MMKEKLTTMYRTKSQTKRDRNWNSSYYFAISQESFRRQVNPFMRWDFSSKRAENDMKRNRKIHDVNWCCRQQLNDVNICKIIFHSVFFLWRMSRERVMCAKHLTRLLNQSSGKKKTHLEIQLSESENHFFDRIFYLPLKNREFEFISEMISMSKFVAFFFLSKFIQQQN